MDRRVTHAVRRLHRPGLDLFVRRFTRIGSQYFLIPTSILAAGFLILAGLGRPAAFVGGAMLFGWIWSPLLKRGFRRGRPDLWPALATEASHSFPSGHATMSTIFFGALAVSLSPFLFGPARVALWTGCLLLVAAVAMSRVYLGAHWLSDVIAGILLGILWLAACVVCERSVATRKDRPPRPPAPASAAPPRTLPAG